jgi:hypothetical protein
VKDWLGGATYGDWILDNGCGTRQAYTYFYAKGTSLERSQNRQQKFHVEAGSPIGVSLGTTSGFSRSAVGKWSATLSDMNLCGNNDAPTKAGIIYMENIH